MQSPKPIKLIHLTLVLFHLIPHSLSCKFSSVSLVASLNIHMDDNRLRGVEEEGWTMVGKKGNQFILNGRPFYFNGFNTYWLMVFAADSPGRAKVTDVFHQASAVGLTVCRTWAFNDGQWRALQKSPSLYDEDIFKALDFVVSEAKKNKIRLTLSLVNHWSDYGGKAQYVKWGKEAGLNLSSDDDFFSDHTLKTYYKNHVQTILNRVNTYTNVAYKDDPTIFAWELMNEPQCTSDSSGDTLQAWIQEMAAYVKSIDPNHLLEVGLEGFYGPSTPERVQFNPNTYATQVGTDFVRNHRVIGVDFASVHIYADAWISEANSDAHLEFYKSWMLSHIEDAEQKLEMPVMFSEFGVSLIHPDHSSSVRDKTFELVYNILVDSATKGGSGAGGLMWQLCPEGTDHMHDGYAVVLSKCPSISDILAVSSAKLDSVNTAWNCRGIDHTEL